MIVAGKSDEVMPEFETDDDEPPLETPLPVFVDEPSAPEFMPYLQGRRRLEAQRALTQWVHQLLVPVYLREVTSAAPWCTRWWLHPEAVMQLHGLHLAWRELTGPGSALSGPAHWHRDYLGPTLASLRDPAGTFAGCKPGRHRDKPPPGAVGGQPDAP
ncbi:DUF4913 domain-containing protein [Micromonospora sp. NPDC051196]|uniref:DUF4913 domain-containing protein n=1 Tax=Micromonospora sp. NPDC051196 TaxID=3155281 RepID=UPI00341416DA